MIEAMASRWGSAPALLGFGLLNEPLVRPSCVLTWTWTDDLSATPDTADNADGWRSGTPHLAAQQCQIVCCQRRQQKDLYGCLWAWPSVLRPM